MSHKVLIFSAPSGAGKSTIVKYLLEKFPNIQFSISATSRASRGLEQDGKDYYFLSEEEFKSKIKQGLFVEYEEVYNGRFYGTLKSEVDRIWKEGKTIVFDVDVVGGLNLKKYFGDKALSVFIQAPSVSVLRERLINRATDSKEDIDKRVSKAEYEMSFAKEFDYILTNNELSKAFEEIELVVNKFLNV